jgi:hypothetical protein
MLPVFDKQEFPFPDDLVRQLTQATFETTKESNGIR